MKTITLEQMDNLIMLRDVIKAKLGQPEGVLDTYFQLCGTYGCVLGDYYLKYKGVNSLSELNIDGTFFSSLDVCPELVSYPLQTKHFGYSLIGRRINVFGTSTDGTIQQRLDFVNNLIANSKVEASEEDKAKTFIESLKQLLVLPQITEKEAS